MAITLHASTTTTVAGGTGSETKSLPGTPAANDYVLIIQANDNNLDGDGPVSGQGYSNLFDTVSSSPGGRVDRKVLTGADTTVDINRRANTITAVLIVVFRGVDTTTPEDVTSTSATGSSGMPDAPSIDPTTNDCMIVACGMLDDDDATATAPANYTNLVTGNTGQASTTVGATVCMATRQLSGHAAENPAAFGGDGSDAWAALSIALRPAATGAILTAASGSFTLSGTAATLLANQVLTGGAESGTFSLTGTAATLTRGVGITADTATFTLSGTAASLQWNHRLAADAGAFTLTGTAATLTRRVHETAGSGSFALTGQAASLEWNRRLSAGAGSFILTGQDATLTAPSGGETLVAGAGSFSLTGTAASLFRGLVLPADLGSFTLSGTAASTRWDHRLVAGAGAFSLTGVAATTRGHYKLTAGAGAFVLTGTAATTVWSKGLAAGAGSFQLNGGSATLLVNGEAATGGGLQPLWRRRRR